MNDDDLKALEEAYAKTTPGWATGDVVLSGDDFPGITYANGIRLAVFDGQGVSFAADLANRDFAVMIHRQFPALLAELRLLRMARENALMRKTLEEIADADDYDNPTAVSMKCVARLTLDALKAIQTPAT
jgi:hypothetical protein